MSVVALAFATLGSVAAASTAITASPGNIELELAEGDTATEKITVEVPEGAAVSKADVYLLMDTTGSMGGSINALSAAAEDVLDGLVAQLPDTDLAFGVGDFKDFQSPSQSDPYAFNHAQSITTDTAAVRAAIDGWAPSGGGDGPEAHFYAYDQIASNRAPSNDGSSAGTIGWRSGAKPILVSFADIAGHDLVCSGITYQVDGHGVDYDITEASVTAKLTAAGITFIGIGASGDGMDQAASGSDYTSACDESGASAGQASRLAAATGGAYLGSVGSDAIVDALVDQVTGAVTNITSLSLVPTGGTAVFVTGISPATYGPLGGEAAHTLVFEVDFLGVEPAGDVDQAFTGGFDVVADGSVVATTDAQVTVPGDTGSTEVLDEVEDGDEREDGAEPDGGVPEVLDEAIEAEPAEAITAEPTYTG